MGIYTLLLGLGNVLGAGFGGLQAATIHALTTLLYKKIEMVK